MDRGSNCSKTVKGGHSSGRYKTGHSLVVFLFFPPVQSLLQFLWTTRIEGVWHGGVTQTPDTATGSPGFKFLRHLEQHTGLF